MPNLKLDDIDRRILLELQSNARISNVELSRLVGLSASPCLRRVHALEAHGIIEGYVSLLNQSAVGYPVSVFVNVTLERQVDPSLEHFEAVECYLMTGDADYLLRVVTKDLESYERFLIDHLTRIPGVSSIKSSFSLKQVSFRTALPL